MSAQGITRRSVLLATAGVAAGRFVRPYEALAARAGTATRAQALMVLPAGSGQPAIVAREAWALGRCRPRVAPEYGSVEVAFVHHTENPNGYLPAEVPGMLRAIFAFHRDGRRWNDIGYNFVVDRFGRIFEARAGGIDEPVVGAQAGGYNYRSTGIGVLGEYGAQQISPLARMALARLLAWKLSLHGVPTTGHAVVKVNRAGAGYSRFPAGADVSLPRIAGHRDADSTTCPGDALYGELAVVRATAGHLAGRPARATIFVRSDEATGAPQTLVGGLVFLDGAPIAGAPILVQRRSVKRRGELVRERTIGQAVTDADGKWSLPVSDGVAGSVGRGPQGETVTARARGAWLRALCPGARGVPASVSEPLNVAGTVAVTPQPAPAPAPTPPATQPPAP